VKFQPPSATPVTWDLGPTFGTVAYFAALLQPSAIRAFTMMRYINRLFSLYLLIYVQLCHTTVVINPVQPLQVVDNTDRWTSFDPMLCASFMA